VIFNPDKLEKINKCYNSEIKIKTVLKEEDGHNDKAIGMISMISSLDNTLDRSNESSDKKININTYSDTNNNGIVKEVLPFTSFRFYFLSDRNPQHEVTRQKCNTIEEEFVDTAKGVRGIRVCKIATVSTVATGTPNYSGEKITKNIEETADIVDTAGIYIPKGFNRLLFRIYSIVMSGCMVDRRRLERTYLSFLLMF
jgi:hypothetical protein